MTDQDPSPKQPPSPSPSGSLPIGEQPADVPSFGCIVYVRSNPTGGVVARVANLPGITVEAATERAALSKLVPQFKQAVQSHLAAGDAVPWIDPPSPIVEGEQKRFLPTHL
ncbi:hypothetical protein K227x_40150 [Rubripirellula lacrimiformis]|uniref:HicB-like antitoxin of toxin-antitoxin system domain-containing protein n=1 Tax=Rubripirellula lacrimiformis TaxID=1930273 RepID=A0A517NEQ8_9BACT|nr:hypothetical protein [Rubripirellula lacrimiformis]QDT05614.1 hypothetical protein K227x_40150 [Rubripirellula lacrimiformis]